VTKKGKERTTRKGKKSQKCNVSHVWGEAPFVDSVTQTEKFVDVSDVVPNLNFKI